MRTLYFCALVLGFVNFFGNRINARDVAAPATCPTNVVCAEQQSEFSAIGSFDNVRASSATGEPHCYGWSFELWRDDGRIMGLVDRHDGLCGDPPCQAITDVSYDAKTGRLAFAALDMRFVGTLRKDEVVGTFGTERLTLKRNNDWSMDTDADESLDGWCRFWRTVPRCKGIGDVCDVLAIP